MESSDKCLEAMKDDPNYNHDTNEAEGETVGLHELSNGGESSGGESNEVKEKCCAGGVHDVKVFLLVMCLFAVTHGFTVNGVNNVNVPMYEKRFQLSSTESALIVSFYDVISLITILFSGYFMAKLHQPRMFAVSALLVSVGCFIMALPHFLTGEYQPAQGSGKPDFYCEAVTAGNTTNDIPYNEESTLNKYLYVFLAGQALNGVAGAILYVAGISYIDGSVSDIQSPIYLSIFFGAATLAPILGYTIGGKLLEVYVDFPNPAPVGLTPRSPAWVGAWWIGLLITSGLALLISLPLFTFPRVLPGTAERRRNNVSQKHVDKKYDRVDAKIGTSFRDIPKHLLLLIRNPAYICQCIMAICEGATTAGLTAFGAKFLANQFNMEIGFSATLIGFTAMPSGFLGQICGGMLIKRFKVKVKGILKLSIAMTVITMLIHIMYLEHCKMNDIAGVNYSYDNSSFSTTNGLAAECNADCGCDTSKYVPVCIDDVQYFSPCYAGCSNFIDRKTKTFSNCSCADWAVPSINDTSMEKIPATHGICHSDCTKIYYFLPIMAFGTFLTTLLLVPATTVVLRSVDDEQRTFAIAGKQFLARLAGSIPGPLIFGAILDSTCLVWQSTGNGTGSCWIYDNNKMARGTTIFAETCKVISLIALIVALKFYKAPPSTPSKDRQST